ncbi:cyclin-J [Tribolium madens]|uniref:cyclin-J n=1 Tax=Tribolium madens TaxID=41895 RepID=UPI001CF71D6E|nr:cyclin-J [Tribolium madens]
MKTLIANNSVFYLRKDVYDSYKEYRDDFKQVVKEREQSRSSFFHQSPQIYYRPFLVGYITKICSKKSLSQGCLHLAVYILDMFMDQHHIIPEKLLLVANVCLIMAAKHEENAQKIPRSSELNHLVDNQYPITDYIKLEHYLTIHFFQHDIKLQCAVHYVFYFMQEFLTFEDLDNGKNLRTLFYDFHEAVSVHLDKIIEDVHYMQLYQPSKLAAAIIAAGRSDIGLTQWTKQLENLTEYKVDDLDEIVENLLEKKQLRCLHCDFE